MLTAHRCRENPRLRVTLLNTQALPSMYENKRAKVNAMDESHAPLRSRTRTFILFWISAVTGVVMFVTQHVLIARGVLPRSLPTGDSVGVVTLGVEIALGVLALFLLPDAIRHDPMEREKSYVGPPEALVASLVILCLWFVTLLAAPAGAVVLISLSARLSPSWTLPAIAASLLSVIVHELTYSPLSNTFDIRVVLGALALTLILVAMGTARGIVLRRQVLHNFQTRHQDEKTDPQTEETDRQETKETSEK